MLKPLRGAAGRGIRIWEVRGSEPTTLQESHYFQERRVGVPVSALFLALPDRAMPLGIASQLVGLPEVHAPTFAWCGTIAPVELTAEIEETIVRIGDLLARQTGLRGLFGCDFIVDHGTPWLTEVNPRYPASTEIIERVLRVPLLDWHRQACESFGASGRPFIGSLARNMAAASSTSTPSQGHHTGVIGKIVVYAGRDLVAPDALQFVWRPSHRRLSGELDNALPYMADIAAPGTRIACGQPICTLFARAASESQCLAKLVRRAIKFKARIE